LAGADGVVRHNETFRITDHPVCGAKVAFAAFLLMPQPPLLFQAELSKLVFEEDQKKGLNLI
jgi:hypothetical protein